jgi:hypothetical protein
MDLKNPTRTEALLANIAGHTDVPVPDMKNATRSERLLKEILDNGGGGGGGDVTKEYVDNAISDAVADIDGDISALSDTVADKVDKENGKSLSTNDYTDADKALVQNSPITTTSTASPIPTANGKPRKLTIYGKSEVVDGKIKSAGEGGAIEVQTCEKNLFDPTKLVTENITYTDGTLSGTASNFNAEYISGIPILFDKTRQITFSVKAYTNGASTEGNGLRINFDYTDNTRNSLIIPNNTTEPQFFTLTSNPAKQVQNITISYGTYGSNIWYLSEIQLEYGSTATAYEPYNGTMATFTTGTPLYGISDTVRDVMTWDGTSGEVTKNCGEVDLGTLNWAYKDDSVPKQFRAPLPQAMWHHDYNFVENIICPLYQTVSYYNFINSGNDNLICRYYTSVDGINIVDNSCTTLTQFLDKINGVMLIYELATPTTMPLTAAENDSLSTLKTYSPQTTVTINDNPKFEIEAYANTANGQAISDMQPTRSPLLTLTASGWANNTQTVTYAHDTAKRNSIDVELASIKAWTAAGILATAETATSITFECDTVPTADLSFRVTSMEVR